MKIVKYPSIDRWRQLCQRPQLESESLEKVVKSIIEKVKTSGDKALLEFAFQFDNASLSQLQVTDQEIVDASKQVSNELKNAIEAAANNIKNFHASQCRETVVIETMPGVRCWRKAIAIEKIGIYIPGGTAPLFSTVLMLGIPAQLAGCNEVILCSPPGKDGAIDPAILFAAQWVGIKKIFRAGGAQAIAAMAFGTESIPSVYKIFGPGNQYVTCAKQLASREGVAIDITAGPSELMIIADENADPAFIASDLLSQAEHGPDSQIMLISKSETLINRVQPELEKQLYSLPRKTIAAQSLKNSLAILFQSTDEIMRFANEYAPEHLIINAVNCDQLSEKVINAGSVFLGPYSPESAGDYASGTNHTLPTNGFAKSFGGVSLESFTRYITFQKVNKEGIINIGPLVEVMAKAEHLEGHANAVSIRLINNG